jgi:uncharacterized protein (DUF885 family)
MPHDNGSGARTRVVIPFSAAGRPVLSRSVTRVSTERHRPSRLIRSAALLAGFVASLHGCATTRRPPSRADTVAAVIRVEGINDDYWRFLQASRPEVAARANVPVTRLPDPTLDRAKTDAQFARAGLAALDQVFVDALPQDSYVSWQSLRWELEALAGWTAFHWTRLNDLSPGQSVFDRTIEILQTQQVADPGAGQRYLGLVNSVSDLASRVRFEYGERAHRGIRLPRDAIQRAIAHVRGLIAPADASPFGMPPGFHESPDSAWRAQLARDVSAAISQKVNLSLDSLASFVEADLTHASDAPGMSRLPGGAVHYATLLRYRSTLDISPEDAHAIGLGEVARVAALAALAREGAGLPVSRDSLLALLAADTVLTADGTTIPGTAARIFEATVAEFDSLFPPTPRVPLSIGIQPEAESSSSLAVYQAPTIARPAARYLISPSRLSAWSSLLLPAMVLGDLMPGLHHQRSTQFEHVGFPQFRRHATHDGYVMGWQVYSLHVGDSLSRSLTPAQRFGVRLRELEAACGLVVDTGINALGWSREAALAFLRSYLPLGDDDLERDFILRAIESPGALSAATLGAREFRGLRQWAIRELGDRFSLSAFHQELLRVGSVPLPVLGSHLERWIWEQNNPVPPIPRGRR